MKKIISLLLIVLLSGTYAIAQVTIDAELRPRFEYRHGYSTLLPDNLDAATFVSQRTRLNGAYTDEKLSFYLSLQDIRVWGDVPQLNRSDRNGFGVHQAWGELKFSPEFTVKLGRQVLSYNDQRILGGVGWAQQARSHDIALLKYQKNTIQLHIGVGFNQDGESLTGTTLSTNTYKAMQYAWLNNQWNNLSVSVLILNNGMQYIDNINSADDETRYSQTLGTHLKYNKNNFGLMANLYYQTGKDLIDNDISAYLLGAEANFKVSPKWKLILGGELQSGNDNGSPSAGENKAFTPLYGTNHKFNGHMDYFYVGNHANNVGLLDLYLGTVVKTGDKTNFSARIHNFNAAANIANNVSNQLGTEADLVYTYNFSKAVNIQAGYSQLFASEGMEYLKGSFDDNINNWGWVMVTIKPTLFKSPENN